MSAPRSFAVSRTSARPTRCSARRRSECVRLMRLFQDQYVDPFTVWAAFLATVLRCFRPLHGARHDDPA
jgi:hypothetical protein